MFKSIRKRLIFNFIVIAVFILTINITFSTYQMITSLQNQMKYDGKTLANNIKTSIENTGLDNKDKIQFIVDETYKHSEGNLYYIGVMSLDKTMLAGTIKEYIGQTIDSKEVDKFFEGNWDEVFNGNTKAFMNEWQGTPAYNVTVPIKQGEKVVASAYIGISVNNMQSAITTGIIKAIITSIVTLILVAITGTILGKRIAGPIESIELTVEKIGKGDLSAEYTVNGNDEIGRLAAASNETTKNIRQLIRVVKAISTGLTNLSKELSNGGEQVSAASEEIAASVTSVSQEGIKQTQALAEAVRILEGFSLDLNKVNNKLAILAEKGEEIKEDSNKGAENITCLSKSIDNMQNSFDTVKNKVGNLDESISQINSIVDVINSVAKQTNLLALNASIEAARAGDAGRGFSVVAEEIRKLAEEVLTSSKNITELVNKVMGETKDVSESTEVAANIIEESREKVEESVSAFKDIINKVSIIPLQINEVNLVLQKTMEGRDKILSTVESVASNSEEISSLSQEVSASTEEQATITGEISVAAKKLFNMANDLENSISTFIV